MIAGNGNGGSIDRPEEKPTSEEILALGSSVVADLVEVRDSFSALVAEVDETFDVDPILGRAALCYAVIQLGERPPRSPLPKRQRRGWTRDWPRSRPRRPFSPPQTNGDRASGCRSTSKAWHWAPASLLAWVAIVWLTVIVVKALV